MKKSDAFIPFGQGRDVVDKTPEAAASEQAAAFQIARKACYVAHRRDACKAVRDAHHVQL